MDAIQPTAKKLHPLVATAAVAVTVVSVLGAIVLITDQVAAHRSTDASTVAASDTSASASASNSASSNGSPAPADTAGVPEKAPPHASSTHKAAKPKVYASNSPAGASSAPPPPPPGMAAPTEVAAAPPPPPVCDSCGIVAGVRTLKTTGQGSGVGAVAGGAVGGLVGNQFGSGKGNTAMTVLGVLGGALAGNEVEKQAKATTQYVVDVRLDNGKLQTVSVPGNPGPIVGMRVRIENGQLVREAAPQG